MSGSLALGSLTGSLGRTATTRKTRHEAFVEQKETDDLEIDVVHDDDPDTDTNSSSEGGVAVNRRRKVDVRSVGEEEWNDEGEKLAKEYAKEAQQESVAHFIAGKAHKCKHVGVGLPAALLPAVMAIVSAGVGDYPEMKWVNTGVFATSAILSGVHSFFGFDRKYQEHMDFSARYKDVRSDIAHEMVKSRRFRVSMDEFLTKIQLRMDNLGAIAPDY